MVKEYVNPEERPTAVQLEVLGSVNELHPDGAVPTKLLVTPVPTSYNTCHDWNAQSLMAFGVHDTNNELTAGAVHAGAIWTGSAAATAADKTLLVAE
jgi:hypothetical protein